MNLKQRFIDLLEQDTGQAHKVAQLWKELEKDGARLEDGEGRTIATAEDMSARYAGQEKELRAMIARIKAL